MKIRKLSSIRAFTLLEIMLVVAIITLLLSTGFYFLKDQINIGRDAKLHADFQIIGQSLQLYENLNGFYPSSEQGLDVLVNQPQTEPKPTHWYSQMSSIPKDPWQSDYVYVYPGKHDPKSFDLVSKGKDRILGTEDDRGNWEFKYPCAASPQGR